MTVGNAKQFPKDPRPEIALSGRSNVGKSSLINTLLSRKSLARVSGTPGKTITINFYDINKKLFFADLPGYGYAKRAAEDKKKWSELTDGYFTKNKNIDLLALVLQLVDSRIGPTADDEMMMNFLYESEIPYLVVATKVDKLNATERKKNLEAIAAHPLVREGLGVIPYSALKNEGKNELWNAIFKNTNVK